MEARRRSDVMAARYNHQMMALHEDKQRLVERNATLERRLKTQGEVSWLLGTALVILLVFFLVLE